MSGITKYSLAPQRDSFDETARYTAAPPSYDATASSSRDQQALLGGPRNSEDNVPDDFKVYIVQISRSGIESNVDQVRGLCRRGDN